MKNNKFWTSKKARDSSLSSKASCSSNSVQVGVTCFTGDPIQWSSKGPIKPYGSHEINNDSIGYTKIFQKLVEIGKECSSRASEISPLNETRVNRKLTTEHILHNNKLRPRFQRLSHGLLKSRNHVISQILGLFSFQFSSKKHHCIKLLSSQYHWLDKLDRSPALLESCLHLGDMCLCGAWVDLCETLLFQTADSTEQSSPEFGGFRIWFRSLFHCAYVFHLTFDSTKFTLYVSLAWLFDELADQQRQVRLGYFHLACRSWWRCWPFQYRYHVQKDPWTPAFLSQQAGHQFIKSEPQRWSSSEWMFQNGIGRELHNMGSPIISQTRIKTLSHWFFESLHMSPSEQSGFVWIS